MDLNQEGFIDANDDIKLDKDGKVEEFKLTEKDKLEVDIKKLQYDIKRLEKSYLSAKQKNDEKKIKKIEKLIPLV